MLSVDSDVDHDVVYHIGKLQWSCKASYSERPRYDCWVPSSFQQLFMLVKCVKWGPKPYLNTFQHCCLICILKIMYRDWVTNKELHCQTSTCPLVQNVVKHQMRFAGYVLWQPPTRLPWTAILWNTQQRKRKQVCPKITWQRTFIEDLSAVNLSWDEAGTAAVDQILYIINNNNKKGKCYNNFSRRSSGYVQLSDLPHCRVHFWLEYPLCLLKITLKVLY